MTGDFTPGKTVRIGFNTHQADGTPITLAGTPGLTVYKDSNTAQSTSGVTLTVDFDSVTGSHLAVIDTSADGAFYSAGSDFRVQVAAGTVDGVSVVGTVVGAFSLSNRSALRPETADRTIDLDTDGRVTLADTVHGGSAAVLTLERVVVASLTTNEPAVKLTGNGTGAGISSTGGVSGPGAVLTGTVGFDVYGSNAGGQFTCTSDGYGLSLQGAGGSADLSAPEISGNLSGTAGGLTAGGWAGAFTENTGLAYGDAVAGSLVIALPPAATALNSGVWPNTLAAGLTTLASHDPGSTLGSAVNQTSINNNVIGVGNSVSLLLANIGIPAVTVSDDIAAANTLITWVKNYLEGDEEIDDSVTPWAVVVTIKNTSTELTRKKLRSVAGADITSTTVVIGSAKDT